MEDETTIQLMDLIRIQRTQSISVHPLLMEDERFGVLVDPPTAIPLCDQHSVCSSRRHCAEASARAISSTARKILLELPLQK